MTTTQRVSLIKAEPGPTRPGWTVRRVVSVAARLAFLLWLYDVTDGAAFSPFSFVGDIFGDLVGGSLWHPVLLVLGVVQTVAGLRSAVGHRHQSTT